MQLILSVKIKPREKGETRSRANTFEIALVEYFASTIFCAIHGANY